MYFTQAYCFKKSFKLEATKDSTWIIDTNIIHDTTHNKCQFIILEQLSLEENCLHDINNTILLIYG